MQGGWLLGTGGSVVPALGGGWAGAKTLRSEGQARCPGESPVRCGALSGHY